MQQIRSRAGRSVLVALLASALLGVGAWQVRTTAQEQETPSAASAEARHQANTLSTAFRKAAEAAVPTVVTIETKTKPQVVRDPRGNKRGETPFKGENPFKGTPFEDFFGGDGDMFRHFGGDGHSFQIPQRQGMGSGVIVDKSGLVLTNNHVVEGADEVTVRLSDDREFKATDIKTDPMTDLAVLRIEGAGSLPYAKLGDSDQLQIGDWVIAVGNPFGLDSTVSAGIISSKGRELSSNRSRFLQTDAAINPGNSGGPLLNLDGEVVGINTAIASNNGGYQGIGFAIPSNQAKWVMQQLIKSGMVQRAYLGVSIGEVNGDLAQQFGVKRRDGVLVAEVHPKTPAAEAGFEAGDLITEYAGKRVHTPRDLQELVERTPIGSKEDVKVLREGKPVDLQVVVKQFPKELGESGPARSDRRESEDSSSYKSDSLGLAVTDLTENNAETLGFKDHKGVVITEVEPDSAAARAGLREGMLVMSVAKKRVENVKEFKEAVKDVDLAKGVLLWIRSDDQNRFVVLKKE
ncbi:MAG TPA: DegQ family serine endoprotease [Pirellulales bacterium]|nr:DegQ family serine endoprotease [Pirellulales bacterium]